MDISNQNYLDTNRGNKPIKRNTFCAGYAFALTVAACLVGSIGSPSLMLFVTALFAPLFLKPEYLLGPILFFSIFDDFLLAAGNASASRFVTLFYIFGAAVVILRKGSIKQTSLYFLLLIALGVVLSLYTTYGHTSFPISYTLNIILAVAMLNLTADATENVAKQLYIYAVLALLYVYFLLGRDGFDSLVEGSRMTIDETVNSNALAMGLAVVMTLLVSNLLLFKKHLFLNVAFIAANLVALFLTGSRTALIAAIAAAFFLYIVNAQDKRGKRKAFFLLVLSVALLIVIYNALQKAFPILMERFSAENVEQSGGSGRIDVWSSYFVHLFPKHWLIGMGFDTSNLYYAIGALSAEAHGAHNVLVDILSRTGIVGLILYFVCFAKFFAATRKNLQTNKSLLLPLAVVLTTLINGIGENILTTRFLWFGIGLGYMFINASNRGQELAGGENGC